MGHNISIGQMATLTEDDGTTFVGVEPIAENQYPGQPGTNDLVISATGFAEFCGATDLTDLFFGEGGLMKHQGQMALTFEHDKRIAEVLAAWDEKSSEAWQTRILKWLAWWVHWAVNNCSQPIIDN